MTEWKAKRFWREVAVVPETQGWSIALDGRPVRTPGRSLLVLPTEGLAARVAEEWHRVGEVIDPTVMPATRMANSAIEKVLPQMGAVADHLASYGETDLLCYRAEGPDALVAAQAAAWDPWLDWAAEALEARLTVTEGVLPVAQPGAALARLRDATGAFGAFELAALHDLVELSGSLVLGLAVAHAASAPETAWAASRVDEAWQAAQWGADEEAERAAARREAAFHDAARFQALAAGRTAP